MNKENKGRKTPFYDMHLRHQARMVNFFGFAMPLQYTSIVAEHRRVRSTVGMFDLSHMGEIVIRGPDALDFVQRMTVNDASTLDAGDIQYSAMCYPHGGIVDDLLVYRLEESYLLVVNASNIDKDYDWLHEHRRGSVELENHSDDYALLAVQGPRAQAVLAKLTDADLDSLRYYHFRQGRAADMPMIISRTGYTGEDGFELYVTPSEAPHLWDAVLEAGREHQLEPVGLGARDSLRLEMKYALYGQDIDETTTPLEAGLSWITKLDKGDFVGREALLEQKERGPTRRLIGFEMKERAIPRPGYALIVGREKLGQVTSGIFSPSLSRGIGTGYLPIQYAAVGTEIDVLIRNQSLNAQVVKTPFYRQGSRK
jgi:aminomethyltransferase